VTDEPIAPAAVANIVLVDMTPPESGCSGLLGRCRRCRQGRADSGSISGAAGSAAAGAAAAGAAAAGAASAGAAVAAGAAAVEDAGRRPANGVPAGSKEARPLSGDAACVSRLAGLVAGAAAVLIGAVAAGSPGGVCGSVIDAVAVCGGVAGAAGVAAGVAAVFSIDVKPCISCVAAAGLDASCWINGRPGTPGVGAGAAGWAAAVPLSATAAVTAPAAAIIVVANSFPVMCMVLPFRFVGTPPPEATELLV